MFNFKIILGSQSPRRKQLLASLGLQFEVRVSNVCEDFSATLAPQTVPAFLAQKKAEALQHTLLENDLLVCADSVVILHNKVINKPSNLAEAEAMLGELSGQTHEVVTGVCLKSTQKTEVFSESTLVTFKVLTSLEITHYLQVSPPLDKAGSYGIQDWIGMIGVSKIEGCYYNVMGLPTASLYSHLKAF